MRAFLRSCVLVTTFGLLIIISVNGLSTSSSGKVKVTYDIPAQFSAGDDLISKFQAISSHGRSAETGSANVVTYTSLQIFCRAFYLFLVFAPMFFTSGLAFVSSSYRNSIWFGLLRFGIAQGGAAFIKWAQWASTRPDIFPESLCSVLSTLQSQAPEHSFSFTKKQIRVELGAPIEEVFETFSVRPIASGSIAQIYKARLNGRDVAVKVRHPNVEVQIGMDFIIMKAMANLMDRTPGLEWLKLSETMSQFSATIASQTDLAVEGKHLYLFNHYFKLWKGVSFPKPIILTDSILVESFEYGDSVDKYVKTLSCNKKSTDTTEEKFSSDMIIQRNKLEELYKQCNLAHFIVTTGEDTYLKMLLQDNLMHADLHPGNILIQQFSKSNVDNRESKTFVLAGAANVLSVGDKDLMLSSRIILVDAGMVARLVPEEQKNFVGLLEAMGEGRGDEAADYVMRFSNRPNYDKSTKLAFRNDMKTLFLTVCKGYGHNVDLGSALRGILNLVRIHQITIDANYATLVMNALCLDGMSSSLLPTYNILDGAKPLLRFNRIVKRIPGSFIFLKIAIPIAQWLKRKNDEVFLKRLRKDLKILSDAK